MTDSNKTSSEDDWLWVFFVIIDTSVVNGTLNNYVKHVEKPLFAREKITYYD